MKNPKSLYVSSVSRLKKTRQVRNIFLLSLLITVIVSLLVVLYVLGMNREIDERFPSGSTTSFSPSVPSTESSPVITEPTEGTTESSTESDSTPSSETTGNETTGTTDQVKKPDPPPPENDVFFEYSGLLQSVTHRERDIAFAKLKQSVRAYIQDSSETRIGFFYSNLKNKEEFGINDLSPFVVGGAINLPINLILYEESRTGVLSFIEVLEYTKADKVDGSGIIIGDELESQYFLRTLSRYSLSESDNIATAMILRRLGGIEEVSERFAEISSIVDFMSTYNYIDFSGKQQSGPHRSGAQDLARYARELYFLYRTYPDHYQTMINDLSFVKEESGFRNAFSGTSQIFGKTGVNSSMKSTAEVSIIICQEPIVLSIIVESDSAAKSAVVQEELAKMVADYITFCYS